MTLSTFIAHLISAGEQTGLSLPQVARRCLDAGISGMDVEYDEFGTRARELEALLSAGMRVNSIPTRCDFCHGKDEDRAQRALEKAVRYGAGQLMIIPGFLRPGDNQDACMARCLGPMEALVKAGARAGVEIGMEDYDHKDYPYATSQGLLYFLERIDGLSCIMDTGNFRFSNQDAWEAYGKLKPYIRGQVHCKDRAYIGRPGETAQIALDGQPLYPCAVGSGVLPMAAIVDDLLQSGFDGSFTLEFFGSADALGDLMRSAAWFGKRMGKVRA